MLLVRCATMTVCCRCSTRSSWRQITAPSRDRGVPFFAAQPDDTADELRDVFADLTPVEVRPMRAQPPESPVFGVDFLQVGLFQRR
ncbi:hypothetical protein E1161_08235 [Saccharopolyspora aridisoli]|uniref:Uncharacterized protein n=1 Tax=Saccharopolyspora aridisoli TaxID=2530385 RepID=A0A4V2Y7Z3_9PSEU|nr:hypothetical protein [Saccharopolyspora aridisoli]TDC93995.1 hypothetical protein E1161_08235 [Saccharopolyspora aridisoli]